MTVAAGTRLGPYEIGDLLGAGGMGEVYRARDPRVGRQVAIKVLPADLAADAARRALFERESRAVAALNHPNVLTLYDVGTHEGAPYVVTELLEGENLRELVSRRSPTPRQVLGYALQAARGLEAAHAKGLVHRDLKPENLFLTTDGRVKVLDFGLAKLTRVEDDVGTDISTAARSTAAGQVAGTLLYMSPEQARGHPVDARSDVFSYGVVLYELLARRHPFRKGTITGTLTAIAEETPPDLEGLGRGIPPAVGGIVRRCLEKAKEDRYASGHDIAVALEAVLAAPSAAVALREVEERSPYPGLSSFTERDAAFFFGREREVEELWGRLDQRKLVAVIGPSGAGKTSFVQAGMLARRPEGWGAILCTPAAHPFRSLGQALAPELGGDPEALRKLVSFEEPDTAVELVTVWRRGHGEALVVVDQLEELFTLSPPEVQERFAALVGRLLSQADVHVLLSLRDDFLIRCCEHPALAPVLQGLTALLPLSAADLRRALEEPARKRGYRFEDEALVTEMVQAVEGARAALPLLAFAVSRLWEKRDLEKKVLTRAAYEEIGGVAGALAQHAEQTLDRIGPERQGMVREVFRNLTTSQGTRAVMDRDELLSVFPERPVAGEVLRELIDARLLTSYEMPEDLRRPERDVEGRRAGEAPPTRHRVEIAHESLLKAWPRLVRWQAQEEEGAVLRDQLRQAAHVWEEKGRSSDVLWSGTAYREFQLWRERYPGQLTAVEEDFARSMAERAETQRRRRRLVTTAAFSSLLAVLVVVGALWWRSERAREAAVLEARRAEAGKLLALGGQELDRYPSAALAYAMASLELFDTPETRLFALKALWRGPTAITTTLEGVAFTMEPFFSPDGRWLTTGGGEKVPLLSRDGGPPVLVDGVWAAGFGPDSELFVIRERVPYGSPTSALRFHSLSRQETVRTLEYDQPYFFWLAGSRIFGFLPTEGGARVSIHATPLAGGEAVRLGRMTTAGGMRRRGGRAGAFDEPIRVPWDVDASGRWLAQASGHEVHVRDLDSLEAGPVRIGRHPSEVQDLDFAPSGDRLVSVDVAGEIRVWSVGAESLDLIRVLNQGEELVRAVRQLAFGPSESGIAVLAEGGTVWLIDLDAPPEAPPLALRQERGSLPDRPAFDPSGRWLATATTGPVSVTLWPLGRQYARVMRGHTGFPISLVFAPDGRRLFSSAMDGMVRVWPLVPTGEGRGRVLFDDGGRIDVDPRGERLLIGPTTIRGRPRVESLVGGPTLELEGYSRTAIFGPVAFSRDGRQAAAAPEGDQDPIVIRVWVLESGEMRVLDPGSRQTGDPASSGNSADGIQNLAFTPDGDLLSAGRQGLLFWDLEDGSKRVLRDQRNEWHNMAASPDGRYVVTAESYGFPKTSEGAGPFLFDLQESTTTLLTAYENQAMYVAFGPDGRTIVAGGRDGAVRVGPVTGEAPHLLLGHEGMVGPVAVSPDGRWIASAGSDDTVRLWPMPDVSQPPLHTLPHEALMAKLRSLTTVRAVPDEGSPTGYRLDYAPFPGWKEVPTW